MTDPGAVRREAMEEAARIADKRQTQLETQGAKHPDNSPSREACAQGAYEAMWLGKAIRRAATRLAEATGDADRVAELERERDAAIEGARQRGVLDDIERKGAIRLAREAIAKQRATEARAQAAEADVGRLKDAARTLVERANERTKGERTAVVNEVIVPINCIRNLWNALASQGSEAAEQGDRG